MSTRSVFYNGNLEKPYALEESKTLFVLRTIPETTPEEIFQSNAELLPFIPQIKLLATFPRSNVYVFKCITNNEKLRNTIKEILKKPQDHRLLYVGSIFQFADTDIYQIYTENIFIKFYDTISEKFIKKFFEANALKTKASLHFGKNVFFVEAIESRGREIFEFCETLLAVEEVQYCHPELVTKLRPELKVFNNESDSHNALEKYWWLQRTGVFEAWKSTQGKGITIAVIDDGLDMNHVAFKDRVVAPRDMLDSTEKLFPNHIFDEGHGTACASIACSGDESSYGVAPQASIMPIKITGIGSVLQSEAFYWAVTHNADVISCSWGPPDGSIDTAEDDHFEFPLPDHTRLAFEYATTKGRNGKGCTIVFAAGNGKEPVKYDGYASSKDVLAVSAINYMDSPTRYTDFGSPVICCFPSGDYDLNDNKTPINHSGIYVADRVGSDGYSQDDYNALFSGTSASCPGVAGVIALMYAINPYLSLPEIKKILISSCERIGDKSEYDSNDYSENYGFGMLRADLAIANTKQFTIENNNVMTDSKKTAVSLHIGINNVDTNFYGGFVSPLFGCVNDMKKMGDLAEKIGYETHYLQDNEATKQQITGKMLSLGNAVEDGGILLITYAGHGAPIPDENNEEANQYDEAWVTYNGFLLDDEINACLAQIKSRIRVVLVSDSCHSQTMTRAFFTAENFKDQVFERSIGARAVRAILERNKISLETLRSSIEIKAKIQNNVFVLALAACGEEQKAKEQNEAGVFTSALLQIYEEAAKTQISNYDHFIDTIKNTIGDPTQLPNVTTSHLESKAFRSQFPFSVEKIDLEGNATVTEPTSTTTIITPISESIDSAPLFLASEILLIETEKETQVTITNEITSRSLAEPQTLKITDGTVTAKDILGHTDWDKAYNLLRANSNKKIEYVEPESISNLYYLDKQNQRSLDSGDYLDTYPNPETFNNPTPFIWHLDDAHSELKRANEAVFPEIKTGASKSLRSDIVKIGHIDTGFIENHPALPVNMNPKHVNISNGNSSPGAIDTDAKHAIAEQQGHGTATMSILAGNWVDMEETEGNYRGFFGAIPYADVLTIKISETVALLSGRNFAKAIDYAVDQGCDVITMSMAGLPSKIMAKAVNRAYENGVIIVSAASNSFSEGSKKILPKRTLYPARYDRVIAATGVAYDNKPYLNSYHTSRAAGGRFMQTCYGPDYVLPTTVAGYTPNISWFDKIAVNPDNSKSYYVKSGGGTSSATPQVAAAAALYVQKYKKELAKYKGKDAWKKSEIVRQALFRSADDSTAYNFVYGNGILKAHNALDAKYAPDVLVKTIKKAEEAPEKRRFLGGIFGVFKNRSAFGSDDKALQEKLEEMMVTEICQLLHKDENLFHYLDELHLESETLSLSENKKLVNDILRSPLASDFLKQQLHSVPNTEATSVAMNNEGINNLYFEDRSGGLSIRATNISYVVHNRKTYKEQHENNAVWVEEFDLEVGASSRGVRGDLTTKLEVSVSSNLDAMDSVMLVEKIYEEGSLYEWKFPGDTNPQANRSLKNLNKETPNTYYFTVNEFASGDRGIFDKLKRVGVKIFKWIQPDVGMKSKALDKIIAKFGENKYEIMVFDLKGEDTLSASGWMNIELLDKKSIYDQIQKDSKPALVLMPGLFSSVEGGFDVFLEVESVRKELLKKHSRYVLGCNMPTVVQGIDANAKKIDALLKGNLKGKSCTVLARSRGGIVARYLFESLWLNNDTKKPNATAPLHLNKLIMFGTPNQGTMIASSKNWKSLFNYTTNICSLTLGTVAPVLPRLLTISKAIALGVVNLPGIDHLEEKSKILLELNSISLNRDNYFVFTSNYEPNQKLLKRLFDEFLVDRLIFKRETNDSVTPVLGAIFRNSKFETVAGLKESQYYVASNTEAVSHFGYLHPKHPQIIEKLYRIL